jgi:FixJ family two-component response regulator
VKILFTSGYADDAIARQGILDPKVAFIQKPYRPKALAKKIRQVLSDNPAGLPTTLGGQEAASIRAPIKG